MGYRVHIEIPRFTPLTLVVVGTGGTGSFVAEGLCRLLGPQNSTGLLLVDPDTVEPHNLARQNFLPDELGEYKARALAHRLATRYRRPIAYSLNPFSEELLQQGGYILIGCVDNHLARQTLHQAFAQHGWSYTGGGMPLFWLDAGNGEHWGQVLVGNAASKEMLKGAFHSEEEVCCALPLPSIQHPALLEAPQVELLPPEDCGEAVEAGTQSPTINQLMATLVVEGVRRLLAGTLEWMSLYVDLEHGLLRAVDATPEAVALVTGLKKRYLVAAHRRKEPAERR